MPELVLGSFRSRMRRLMLGAAALTVLAAPSLCAVLVVAAAGRQAETYAARVASLVQDIAAERPTLWQYDSARIVHHLRAYRDHEDIAAIDLLDGSGRRVEVGQPAAPLAIADATAAVWVDGQRVGTVTVSMAPAPVARLVGIVAALAGVVGGILALFGYRIPVQALGDAAVRLDRAHEALLDARAAAAATAADEAARRQIASDLHDGLGQGLVALRFALDRLEREAGVGDETLAPSRRLVDGAIAEVRRAVRALRPAALDDLGLAAALRVLATEVGESTGLAVEVEADERASDVLDDRRRTVLYRVAQELLANVQRHAEATRVTVTLRERAPWIVLVVEDDGRGLRGEPPAGGGLGGLRERLGAVGGALLVERPARGTRVVAQVPGADGGRRAGGTPAASDRGGEPEA